MISILFVLSLLFDVRGVVTDPAGRPVEGAQVTCGSAQASTDDNGAFTVSGTQDCTATIAKEGFANASMALKAEGDNKVVLPISTLSERIVVSATGAPVSLEEAGVSGNVFTEKDLTIRQSAPVSELLRDVSGLTVVQTGSNGGTVSLFARGGNSNTTLILLDGIPQTDPGGTINLVNLTSAGLERIEAVRGPQGALYGAEASSGVIQMFSKQGDVEARVPHGSLAYERGSFSTDHWTAGLGGGLGSRLDYYLTTDQNRSTGQFQNNIFRITSGTANVGYRISDSTTIRGTSRVFNSITGTPGLTGYQAFDLDGRGNDQDRSMSLKVEDTRGDHFSQRAYYAYHQLRSVNVNPNTESYVRAALLVSAPPLRPGTPELNYLGSIVPVGTPGAIQRNITAFGGGFQLFTDRSSFAYQGTVNHKNGTFVFGYENERQGGDLSNVNVRRRNNGLSLFEQFSFKNRIFLSGGARVEHSSVYGSRFAPRGAITFLLPTNTYLRLSLARGIQEPTLLQTNSPNPGFPGNPDLKPERTGSFEAGLTRQWLGGRFRGDIAYFRNAYTNLIQFQTIDPITFAGSWFNVDKAYARGVEASGSVRLTDYATINASYTRLTTRWVSGSEIGQELARRPPNSGTLALTMAPAAAKWSFLIGARFVGERRDTFNTFGINRMAAYQYAYVNASYQVQKNVGLYIRVNNLSDELYQEVGGFQQWGRNATGGVRLTW